MMLLQTRFVETETHEADTFEVTCADCSLVLLQSRRAAEPQSCEPGAHPSVSAELSVVLTRLSDGVGSFRWVLCHLVWAL